MTLFWDFLHTRITKSLTINCNNKRSIIKTTHLKVTFFLKIFEKDPKYLGNQGWYSKDKQHIKYTLDKQKQTVRSLQPDIGTASDTDDDLINQRSLIDKFNQHKPATLCCSRIYRIQGKKVNCQKFKESKQNVKTKLIIVRIYKITNHRYLLYKLAIKLSLNIFFKAECPPLDTAKVLNVPGSGW